MDVNVLFTCHNRIEKTKDCVYSLDDPDYNMRYVVVDDGCTDGTGEMLREFAEQKKRELILIQGNGSLYWAGAMRLAMETVLERNLVSEYILLINDDVLFFPDSIKHMINSVKNWQGYCLAGATCDSSGKISHGGLKYDNIRVKEIRLDLAEAELNCDVADMNAFIIPFETFIETGVFDSHYHHSMADYDYCFELRRHGYYICMTDYYVGICNGNPIKETWKDTSLPRKKRLELKESPKGLPYEEWFYYLSKNFGVIRALWHSITPYVRIFIGL